MADKDSINADRIVAQAVIAYEVAEGKISALILDAIQSPKPYSKKRLRRSLDELRKLIAALSSTARPLVARSIIAAYGEGATTADKAIRKAGVTVSPTLNPQDKRAIAILVQNATTRLDQVHSLVGRRAEDIIRQEGLRAARVTIEQKSAGAGAKALREALVRQKLTAQVKRGRILCNVVPIMCKDGKTRNYLISNYTQMVASNTAREAHAHAVANRVIDKYRAGILDSDIVTFTRHNHSCSDICAPYQGKSYSLTGADERFPKLPVYPPLHPNCKHFLTPGPFIAA